MSRKLEDTGLAFCRVEVYDFHAFDLALSRPCHGKSVISYINQLIPKHINFF